MLRGMRTASLATVCLFATLTASSTFGQYQLRKPTTPAQQKASITAAAHGRIADRRAVTAANKRVPIDRSSSRAWCHDRLDQQFRTLWDVHGLHAGSVIGLDAASEVQGPDHAGKFVSAGRGRRAGKLERQRVGATDGRWQGRDNQRAEPVDRQGR